MDRVVGEDHGLFAERHTPHALAHRAVDGVVVEEEAVAEAAAAAGKVGVDAVVTRAGPVAGAHWTGQLRPNDGDRGSGGRHGVEEAGPDLATADDQSKVGSIRGVERAGQAVADLHAVGGIEDGGVVDAGAGAGQQVDPAPIPRR